MTVARHSLTSCVWTHFIYVYMLWLIPHRWGFFGRSMVNSCMLVGGCNDRFLMHPPYCSLDRQRFWMRMVGMLLALSASCVFLCGFMPLCLELTTGLSSLMNTSCLGLRPPAAMTDGWFPPVQAVCSADPCNAFSQHHDRAFLFWTAGEDSFGHVYVFHPCDVVSSARWTLCWAGWLFRELLHSTRGLAIWCQGWSASSVGETAPVAWSASDREPRSLHHTGGWEQQQWPCIYIYHTVHIFWYKWQNEYLFIFLLRICFVVPVGTC